MKWSRVKAFWNGMLSAFDLSPLFMPPDVDRKPAKDGFQQDWDNIGKDFRKVIKDE